MTTFVQFHLLTFYPPANLNRDDTGRPKTAFVGGVERLRVSSQALKRAVRTSDAFKNALAGHLGQRSQRFGLTIKRDLVTLGIQEAEANNLTKVLAAIFGNLETKSNKELFLKQLAFISPNEMNKIDTVITRAVKEPEFRARLLSASQDVALDADDSGGEDDQNQGKKKKQSKATTKLIKDLREEVLLRTDSSVDIAMFGRMLANSSDFNREAAVQVAHAVTTHKVAVEDDFYAAVDELKEPAEDVGAAFLGELGFGSGVFYIYVCVDAALLKRNLGGDEAEALAKAAVSALINAFATVSPTGKQASFASRARASYVLAEKGDQQPRTLAAAFVKPIKGDDLLANSIAELQRTRDDMNLAYGACADAHAIMNVPARIGSLAEIQAFATEW